MDVEGIYRKPGGNGLVKIIQEGFEKSYDYDISDPDLDITAVTSVYPAPSTNAALPLIRREYLSRKYEPPCSSARTPASTARCTRAARVVRSPGPCRRSPPYR